MKPTAMDIKYKVFQVSDIGNVVIVVKVFSSIWQGHEWSCSVIPPSQNSKRTTSAGIGKNAIFGRNRRLLRLYEIDPWFQCRRTSCIVGKITRGLVCFYGSATPPAKGRGPRVSKLLWHMLTRELFAVANLLVTSARLAVVMYSLCLSLCLSVGRITLSVVVEIC